MVFCVELLLLISWKVIMQHSYDYDCHGQSRLKPFWCPRWDYGLPALVMTKSATLYVVHIENVHQISKFLFAVKAVLYIAILLSNITKIVGPLNKLRSQYSSMHDNWPIKRNCKIIISIKKPKFSFFFEFSSLSPSSTTVCNLSYKSTKNDSNEFVKKTIDVKQDKLSQ